MKWLTRWFTSKKKPKLPVEGSCIPRSKHSISRKAIPSYALKVLYTLHNAGYQAYLVGGGVRDLLLDKHPKDFDVVTNARPEQIKKLFRHCRLIGRRFRLAHVLFGKHLVEVTTFRSEGKRLRQSQHREHSSDGMILRDNVYGTLDEDVFRRDFTVNALYYNIADFTLFDKVGGLHDLQSRCLRLIGDPSLRYREDPVRILRAIRFAAKLDFSIAPETESPLCELGYLLEQVPPARLLEEEKKLFLSGHALKSFHLLRQYQIFKVLFSVVEKALTGPDLETRLLFIEKVLADTDERCREDKPITFVFILAAFFWLPVHQEMRERIQSDKLARLTAFYEAFDVVFDSHHRQAISKRFVQSIRELWLLVFRLEKRTKRHVMRLIENPKFRMAYDFLLVRATLGDQETLELAHWWQNFVEMDETQRAQALNQLPRAKRYRKKRKK